MKTTLTGNNSGYVLRIRWDKLKYPVTILFTEQELRMLQVTINETLKEGN